MSNILTKVKGVFKKKKKEELKGSSYILSGRDFDKDLNKRYKGWAVPLSVLYEDEIADVIVKADTGTYSIRYNVLRHYGKIVTVSEVNYIVVPLKYWTKTK